MKEDNDILKQIGRRDGMTVDEGYFAEFAEHMAKSLPHIEFEDSATKAPAINRTMWQRLRPYVYMAAMFAGVWCMLKMFTMLTSPSQNVNSEIMAEALGNEVFVNDYLVDDVDDFELFDEMMENGADINDINYCLYTSEEDIAEPNFYYAPGEAVKTIVNDNI